jgi:hypothetical protein
MKAEFITVKKAGSIKRTMPKSKTMEEYEGYLKQLLDGKVDKFEVSPKDGIKPQTVRGRLIR